MTTRRVGLFLGVLLLSACEGAISSGMPSVSFDGGGTPPGTDAGTTPPPGSDSGTPSDPCGGLTMQGRCDGDTARWCEGGTVREEACGDRGCGVDGGLNRCNPDTPPIPTECATPTEAAELEITNRERRAMGVRELRCDPGLARAARLHSQDMCDQDYFDHDSLDGRSFVDRINEQDVTWRTVGENIAWGYETPEAVHQGWMDSPGHRRNILNGDYGRIGIGHVECGGRHYWTQDFAD